MANRKSNLRKWFSFKKRHSTTDRKPPSVSKSDSDLSASPIAGSEEIVEFVCQPCLTDNVNAEASGYCVKCGDYLCGKCYDTHQTTPALRHHKLLRKADIPKTKPSDVLTETCSTHHGDLLEHFCSSHDQLCCSTCLNQDHKSCQTSNIYDVSDGIANSDEYKQLMADLGALVTKVTKQYNRTSLCTQDNDKYQSEALIAIRDFRTKVDSFMDSFEENAMMKLIEINQENSENIETASAECHAVLSKLTGIIADLDTKSKSGNNNQLYVKMKMARQQLAAVETSDTMECHIARYRFHQDDKLHQITSALSALWSLSIMQDGGVAKARYRGEVSVKSSDDKRECIITGVATLPNGRIVVADFKNECVKLVDTRQNRVTSRLSLSLKPADITIVGENQVAVSSSSQGKIEIIAVTDVLSRSRSIKVDEGVHGLCYVENKFILAYLNDSLLKIIDIHGAVLNTIPKDKICGPVFKAPRYVTPGRGGDVIYVSDQQADTVTTMTLSGHVISVYRCSGLKIPLGVTAGAGNRVYVCSHDSHAVHQLSATGNLLQILLDRQGGLSKYPLAIAYDDTTDRLYISSASSEPQKSDYVKIFQLE